MAINMNDVRAALEPEEPDYDEAARMGAEIVPFLQELVKGDDPEFAAKAASLAGMLADDSGMPVVKLAAESADPIVRVAAAGAAQGLSDTDASEVLDLLIGDADIGVQKTAIRSVPAHPTPHLTSRLTDMVIRGDLPADMSESIRSIVDQREGAANAGGHVLAGEMPGFNEQTPGLNTATLVDETPESHAEFEQEMPGGGGDSEYRETGAVRDMPGVNQDVERRLTKDREMPGPDGSESSPSAGAYNFDYGALGEMPK